MVTSAQIRAARALLAWTVRDLADAANVHRNTISRFETQQTEAGHAVAAIRAALEAAGIVFLTDAEVLGTGIAYGVALRKMAGLDGDTP